LVTVNTAVDACARGGRAEKCLELVETLEARGIAADSVTLSTTIKGFCLQGDIEKALALAESMPPRGLQPDIIIYNTILDGCAAGDKFALCDEVFEKMQRAGIRPTNFTLTVLIKRYGRAGEVDKAFGMEKMATERFGFKLNSHALTCLISACVHNRRMDRAFEVLEKMRTKGPYPDSMTYDKVISGCLRYHDFEKAYEVTREAYGLTGGPKLPLDFPSLERLIDALVSRGKTGTHAVPLLQELRAAGVPVPQKLVAATLHGAVQSPERGQQPQRKQQWRQRR